MPQDISLQNAASHKSGLTFLQGFPFRLYDVLYSDKKNTRSSLWMAKQTFFFWAEEMPAFKTEDVLPVLCSSPLSKITHRRPDLAAAAASRTKLPLAKQPQRGLRRLWASSSVCVRTRCLCMELLQSYFSHATM